MSIKVDLHVHSKVSKAIPFRMEYFDNTVVRAKKVGLNGFALTEHIHSADYWHSIFSLAERFDYKDGRFHVAPGFNVLTGAEVTVKEVADLIVIGTLEALFKFDQSFEKKPGKGHHPRLADVFGPAREAGLLLIGAHAFRPGKRLADAGLEMLAKFDALEVNGKDVANGHESEVIPTANELGLPVVGSSDAHIWSQVGVQRSILNQCELTQESLRESIAAKQVELETLPSVRALVNVSKAHKTIYKNNLKARGRKFAEAVNSSAGLIAPVPVMAGV
jgi:hypothetical protein